MIVFSDMDGTLLTSDKQMGDATWAMLDELARRSIEFVPCTGRPLSGVFEPILAHPAVHYAVCANGASVWQLDDDVQRCLARHAHFEPSARSRHCPSRPSHRRRPRCDLRYLRGWQCFLPRSLYGRLDEFCGGDPTSRLRSSAHEHRSTWISTVRSTGSRRSNASPCTGTTRPIATPSRLSSTRSEALRSRVLTP